MSGAPPKSPQSVPPPQPQPGVPRVIKRDQGLATVIDEAFKSNSKIDEEDERPDDHEGHEEELEIRQPDGYTMTTVYPPQPCERCVRTNKTCKGVAGARCEHCKNLHQKCSNSTGPPRGKHAGKSSALTTQAVQQAAGQSRPKRKATTKSNTSRDVDQEDDEEDEIDELEPPTIKKRKTEVAPGAKTARLLKDLEEVEASIKRLQNAVTKETGKMKQILQSLAQGEYE